MWLPGSLGTLSCPEIDQFQGTLRLKHVYEQEQGCSVEGFQQGTQCTNIYFWRSIGTSDFILDVINNGYKIIFNE